ncbi:hypothetical protein [Roseateles violae]|uniref:Uncharacterized protein n=1 Tax=Roseateles violae TaxID=3058042 RepID=A0ABT8DSQ5_9BURK|nr:hypothetical protein [Pelomonas sp. PFR6]MDN3919186.1 hypothetical protein [Pelomonas sp. PFR6]
MDALHPQTRHQELAEIQNNPDLLFVDIVEGRLWLSEDARCDIEGYAGDCPETESPLQMLEFLQSRCAAMQADYADDEGGASNDFMAFCVLKGIEHAIETLLYGQALIGQFRPEGLIEAFKRGPDALPSYTLH